MATSHHTVLVLGGAGSVGAETVRQLARRGHFRRILIADRNHEAAQQLGQTYGAEAVAIDVRDMPALVALMRRASVVLNTTGPFTRYAVPIVRAAIDARVHYADVNDEIEPLQEIFTADDIDQAARAAGRTLVVGLGTSPGLTNILARYGAQQMDRVAAVHMALCTGPWTRGAAVWAHRLHVNSGLATIFRAGAWQQVPAMSEAEVVTFPWPPGHASVHIVAHPEPLMLPRSWPSLREVVTKLGYPETMNQLLRDVGRYGLASQEPVILGDTQSTPAAFLAAYLASAQAERCFGFGALTPYSARQVRVSGIRAGREVTIRYQLALPGGPPETALPLVIAAEMLADNAIQERGVLAPEALDPLPFLHALPSLGAVQTRVVREETSSDLVENLEEAHHTQPR
jgi:saccharopine dehydrogenase (NAD+, L-lysine-forming)